MSGNQPRCISKRSYPTNASTTNRVLVLRDRTGVGTAREFGSIAAADFD